MMKVEQRLICIIAPAIQFLFFSHSALWEWAEWWKKRELTAIGAWMEIGWLVWLSLICGLRAAAGRTAPQREDKPTKTNQLTLNSFLWDEMKWNPTKKWNGRTNLSWIQRELMKLIWIWMRRIGGAATQFHFQWNCWALRNNNSIFHQHQSTTNSTQTKKVWFCWLVWLNW